MFDFRPDARGGGYHGTNTVLIPKLYLGYTILILKKCEALLP